MLISSSVKIRVPQIHSIKVHKLQLAYENTFVLFCSPEIQSVTPLKPTFLIHMNRQSKIIHQYHFKQNVEYFVMINSQTIVGPQVKQNSIFVINLKAKTKRNIEYTFISQLFSLNMFVFSQSNLVCLVEVQQKQGEDYNTTNNNTQRNSMALFAVRRTPPKRSVFQKIKLSYFKNNDFSQPVVTHTHQDIEVDLKKHYHDFIKQNNDHSLVSIRRYSESNKTTEIVVHQLDTINEQSQYQLKVLALQLSNYQTNPNCFYNIWEFSQDRLIRIHYEHDISAGNLGKMDKAINKLKLNLKQYEFNGHPHFLKEHVVLSLSTLKYDPRCKYYKLFEQLWYFSYHQNELKQVATSKSSELKSQCRVCSYDRSVLVESVLINVSQGIQVIIRQMVEMKNLYMFMLLHINQDFDDDLLMEAIELLGELN